MKTFTHYPIHFPTIERIDNDGERVYKTPEGNVYPSITRILAQHNKKPIQQWRDRVGEEVADKISKQASTRGTKFHLLTEQYLGNSITNVQNLTLLDQEIFQIARPELDKIDDIHAQEAMMYSDHLRVAGTCDCIGKYDGKRSIIDFKTARAEKRPEYIQHYFMQATAYSIMFEERTGIPVSNLVIIVAVDDGFMQTFTSKRDKHVKDLLKYRDKFEKKKV